MVRNCSEKIFMATIRLTSKRQATFPRAVCEALRLEPGDAIALEVRWVDGEPVWVLRPVPKPIPRWFGHLRRFARGKPHAMAAIRKSIGKGRTEERSP
jgi:bifunctional DNA-binding transcriptional regulator/antitoxin component of YhaV-PrlF toxin-antitoxin module